MNAENSIGELHYYPLTVPEEPAPLPAKLTKRQAHALLESWRPARVWLPDDAEIPPGLKHREKVCRRRLNDRAFGPRLTELESRFPKEDFDFPCYDGGRLERIVEDSIAAIRENPGQAWRDLLLEIIRILPKRGERERELLLMGGPPFKGASDLAERHESRAYQCHLRAFLTAGLANAARVNGALRNALGFIEIMVLPSLKEGDRHLAKARRLYRKRHGTESLPLKGLGVDLFGYKIRALSFASSVYRCTRDVRACQRVTAKAVAELNKLKSFLRDPHSLIPAAMEHTARQTLAEQAPRLTIKEALLTEILEPGSTPDDFYGQLWAEEKDAYLRAVAAVNHADILSQAGDSDTTAEALAFLSETRPLVAEHGGAVNVARLKGIEARVRQDPALFAATITDLTGLGAWLDATLWLLELAVLHLSRGERDECRQLLSVTAPLLSIEGVSREAVAAVCLFRQLAQDDALSTAAVEAIRREVQRSQHAARVGVY